MVRSLQLRANELVWIVPGGLNKESKIATVVRGVRGTTAVSHDSRVAAEINPRYPFPVVMGAMKNESMSGLLVCSEPPKLNAL
jgi:hypothetical protein